MSKQAMKMALDALELHTTIEGGYCSCCGHQPCLKTCSVIQAIDALHAALDAPYVPMSDEQVVELVDSTFYPVESYSDYIAFAHAVEQEVRGTHNPSTLAFAPFDARDDLK